MHRKVFSIIGSYGIFRQMPPLQKKAGRASWEQIVLATRDMEGHARHPVCWYYFKVYALDCELDLLAGANKTELQDTMKGHILATGELMALFEK